MNEEIYTRIVDTGFYWSLNRGPVFVYAGGECISLLVLAGWSLFILSVWCFCFYWHLRGWEW